MTRLLFALLVYAALAPIHGAEPDQTLPAINEVEPWQQVGQQPYEMTWVQRHEHPKTLVDFEDLSGWTLELYGGASGELRRSREQQMWGQYVAKLLYAGTTEESRLVMRPPEPVPIPGRFDSIEMWAFGNRWRWNPDPTTPAAEIAVLLMDATGEEVRVQVSDIRWKHWWLVHRKMPAEALEQITWPASFAGIEITKGTNKDLRYFYCDSLAFYTEEFGPLELKPQPKRNLKPFRGQNVGTNTGPGTLPFPTREETILPANFESGFEVSAREPARNEFVLRYEGRDAEVVYTYRPATGNLGELAVSVGGQAAFKPMQDGGVRLAGTPEGEVAEGVLESAEVDGNVVRARFRHGSALVDYELRLWQKSLVLDVRCEDGEATEVSFGHVAEVENPRLITVPYITLGHTNPRVLLSGSAERPTFTSIWFDWYRSNASAPYFVKEPEVTETTAQINGGMRYIPKTNGVRNSLYERIFLTVSPMFEETLPSIPNPASLRQEEGSSVVWTVAQPEVFAKDHERCRRIRSYGLDKIMQHSHEVTWRDHGDSYTMRLQSSPQKGGDAALQEYIAAQHGLGWLQGIYTNYCDFAPVNTNWSPDHVQRMPDGDWRRAWPRTYALKPSKAVEMNAYYAPRIKEKFDVRMSYTDVHTDHPPPWEYCDYDHRVPGAGTFAATIYAYGQLLLNDQRIYGPTQSEGTFQWMFAGLQSGGYGWVYNDVNLLTHPLDVAFMLHKIHPLECDYGMGYFPYYVAQLDKKWKESPQRRDYVDLFLATTIGYGNMGWLVKDWGLDEPFGVEVMARSYYMMQQLQRQYAFVRPRKIEYWSREGRFVTPSEAHASGALADSRLHVVYENGTEVYVNRSPSEPWTVQDSSGADVKLPVAGWLAFNEDAGFYEVSAEIDGRRNDYVKSAEYEYLDARGEWNLHGGVGASGGVARRDGEEGIELIDIYGNRKLAFRSAGAGKLTAFDADGKEIGEVELRSQGPQWYEFDVVSEARRYVFAASN
jgi:hypothetical protein